MWSFNPSIPDKLAFSSSWSMFSYVCNWHLKLFTRHWQEGNLHILLHLHVMNSNIISRSGDPCNQFIESWSLSMIPQYPGLRVVYCDISPGFSRLTRFHVSFLCLEQLVFELIHIWDRWCCCLHTTCSADKSKYSSSYALAFRWLLSFITSLNAGTFPSSPNTLTESYPMKACSLNRPS